MTSLIAPRIAGMIPGLCLAIILVSTGQAQTDLSQPWESEGDRSYFDSATLDSLLDTNLADLITPVGAIVIHRGKIVGERYYDGSSDLETFNVWSVTKSYMATLVGQAIDQAQIAGTDSTLDHFFPDHSGDYLPQVTLGELLSMSSGYLDHFTYPAWVHASTQELIDMPNVGAPGPFLYNSSACNLLSHIIYEGTGLTPLAFANIHLFPHLGIVNPAWLAGYNSINDGSASLELTLREMVKLGQLYLQGGMSGATEVVSPEWVSVATSRQATSYSGYGYLWWLKENSYSAIGAGGQYVIVVPGNDLVIGIHSGPGDSNSDYRQLMDILYDQIIPLFDLPVSAIDHGRPMANSGPTAFPNPFNPSTRIGFTVDSAGPVSLKIYDLGGRLVRVLADGASLDAGENAFSWDGRSDSGRRVVSGVYLSRLDIGGVTHTGRMLLLK